MAQVQELALDLDRDAIEAFCRKWRITELSLFGSVLRPAEFLPDSDVDFLVTFDEIAHWTLFDLVEMQDELRSIVGETSIWWRRSPSNAARTTSGEVTFSRTRGRSMSRDDAYVLDMLRFAREVVEFSTGVSREQYLADLGKRRSIERSLELVGEAARRVSTSFKDVHPEIPWRDIIGQRSVLAHDYGEVSDERV